MVEATRTYRWWEDERLGSDELCVIHAKIVKEGNDSATWREHRIKERFGAGKRTFQEYAQGYRDRPHHNLQDLFARLGRRACEIAEIDLDAEKDARKRLGLRTLIQVASTCAQDAIRVKSAREVLDYTTREDENRRREERHEEWQRTRKVVAEEVERQTQAGREMKPEDIIAMVDKAMMGEL